MSDKWMKITDAAGAIVSAVIAAALWLRALGAL